MCLTGFLMLVGLIGCVLPVLPGTTLILLAALLHRLLIPSDISWLMILWIGVAWLISIAADFVGTIIGTRMFGGGKWGMAGATGGALVGMFISLPALLIGTFIGAAAAEKFVAKKSGHASLKAGVGATIGFLLSTVARVGCAVAMIALFMLAVINARY